MNLVQLMTWIPLVPLLATLGIVAADRHPNLRETISIAAGILMFILVVMLAGNVSWDQAPLLVLAEPLPGLALAFSPEPLGMLFALVASFLWPVTTLSVSYTHLTLPTICFKCRWRGWAGE